MLSVILCIFLLVSFNLRYSQLKKTFVFSLYFPYIVSSLSTPRLYQITQPFDHAECPTWDNRKSVLYFVDIHQGNVHGYDFYTKETNSIHFPGDVSVVVPTKTDPNLLVVAVNRSLVALDWDYSNGKTLYKGKILTTVSAQFPTSRFNDGKADVDGRLWIGNYIFSVICNFR